jgi:hypothetical protein
MFLIIFGVGMVGMGLIKGKDAEVLKGIADYEQKVICLSILKGNIVRISCLKYRSCSDAV